MLRLTNIRSSDGRIIPDIEADDGSDNYSERDMSAFTAVPGYFDSHIHGSFGFDVSDGNSDDVISLAKRLPSCGVSGFLPTLMTLDEDHILKAAGSVAKAISRLKDFDGAYAEIAGLRLEGPFLNPRFLGVQNPDCLVDSDRFAEIIEKTEKEFPGLIKMIDIAPELDGAMDIVSRFTDRYVISLGHSDSDYENAAEFFANGGNSLTHALNAMRPCLKREPGPLGAAFDAPDSYVEVICDGIHVDQSMLRMLFKLFEDRVIVVSDAMRAGGMPDGIYDLGGIDVESRGGRTYFGPGGNLAGSVTNPSQEAERLFSYGIPANQVIKALTDTPRKRLNIENKDLSGGAKPCLNFVDDTLRLKSVISRGRLVSPYLML